MRFTVFFHFLTGLIVLAAVALPSLTRLELAEQVEECDRRRARLSESFPNTWADRVCPRDNAPYLYSLSADSTVVIRCPNGHGEEPLPLHVWVSRTHR